MGGGHSNSSEDKKITNDANFKNAVRKSSQVINNISTSLLQKQLTSIQTNSTVTQKMDFSHLQAKGDIKISNIKMKNITKINISVLADTKMKESLVQNLTQSIQDKMKTLTTSTQSQLDKQGEQIFSDVVGDISNTVSSLGSSISGGSSKHSADTTLAQLMNVDNETDLDNKIKQAVSTDLVNNMVNKVSNVLIGDQEITIDDVKSKEGQIVISDISQDILEDTIVKTVSTSGLSEGIIASFSGTSLTDIQNINDQTQDTETKKDGTISDLGDATSKVVDTAGDAGSKLILATLLPWLLGGIAVLIFLGFILFAFRGVIGSVVESQIESDDEDDDDNTNDEGDKTTTKNPNPSQTGNGKNDIFNDVLNMILISVILLVVCLIIRDLSHMFMRMERYNSESKLMKINGIYWIGHRNDPINLVTTKREASKIFYKITKNNKMMIKKIRGNKDLFLKFEPATNSFIFTEFDDDHAARFKFSYIEKKHGYYISHGDKYLNISRDKQLIGSKNSRVLISFRDL